MLSLETKTVDECEGPTTITTSVTTAERARQREISSYLTAASVPTRGRHTTIDDPLAPPTACKDNNLTALVQLGVLRLDCDRGFLSLIDGSHQFIVAEATRTFSWNRSLPSKEGTNDGKAQAEAEDDSSPNKVENADDIYLGVQALHISFGVCPNTMTIFTDPTGKSVIQTENIVADCSRYIIRNFQADAHYREKPYVKDWPHMRSYAEVPLVSPMGYVIGSYCVVDNKLRDFGDHTVAVLGEVASTIMAHLDLNRTKQSHARSDQLMKGLGYFMTGGSSIGESRGDDPTLPADLNALDGASPQPMERTKMRATSINSISSKPELRHIKSNESSIPTRHSSDSSVSELTSIDSPDDVAGDDTPLTTPETGDTAIVPESGMVPLNGHGNDATARAPELDRGAIKSKANDSLISNDVRGAFSRAATLLRQSMEIEGVVFLDAFTDSFEFNSRHASSFKRNDVASETATKKSDFETSAAKCTSLASSVKPRIRHQDDTLLQNSSPGLSRRVLGRLIWKYPRGQVLSADEFGPINEHPGTDLTSAMSKTTIESHSELSADISELFRSFPEARSIILLPLRHFERQRWYVATLAWTTDPTHAFDVSDLVYLSSFGNSVMAEVSRFEAVAISSAKSDFISSISHELRSPLHGILASADLLREYINGPSETPMIDMIESCGTTLLDTMNHLLDFAKINKLTAGSSHSGGKTSQPTEGPLGRADKLSFDQLGTLLQDVVEIVYLGHFASTSFKHRLVEESHSASIAKLTRLSDVENHAVLVSTKIENMPNSTISMAIGAWKRIVMNIFGNSLKYTTRGHIEVDLKIVDFIGQTHSIRPHVCLSIKDTGLGMSPEFLKYRAFTPFAQENSLSPGSGLGLSIVHQIVSSLGGVLEVESDLGVGTHVRTFIPLDDPDKSAIPTSTNPSIDQLDPEKRLKGLTLGLISPEHDVRSQNPTLSGSFIVDPKRYFGLNSYLQSVASNTFGMKAKFSTSIDNDDVDFFAIESKLLDSLRDESHNQPLRKMILTAKKPIIAVRFDPSNRSSLDSEPGKIVYLQNPITTKKFGAAIFKALESETSPSLGPDTSASSPKASRSTTPPFESKQKDSFNSLNSPDSSNSSPSHSSAQQSIPTSMPSNSRNPHVLLVDDNAINLKILTTYVQKLGCTYVSAINGLEAVEIYKASTKPFEYIFMDISMPVMDGFTASREIRGYERSSSSKPCRIIALTGLGSAVSQQEAFASGMDLFLTKPVPLKDLKALLID